MLGCCVVVVGCWLFLFRKATLGFDAVVVVRGLAAATGFGLGALLDVLLRHTPPGGEVEGDPLRPGESPVPLQAVPLQLLGGHKQSDSIAIQNLTPSRSHSYSACGRPH